MGYEDYIVKTPDELIEIISGELEKEINQKKKLVQVCEEAGLYDNVSLFDYRTFQLVELYNFYKYSPHTIDSSIFFDAVNILNQYEARLI